MAHLTICRGLPGSGKSTWANVEVANDRKGIIRINRDSLRLMAHDGVFEKGVTEEFILIARNTLIEKFLKKGMVVISDDTNLPKKSVSDLIKIANKVGASWSIKDFTDVPLDVCIERDANREKSVGAAEITNMNNRFLKGKQPLDFSALEQEVVDLTPYVSNPDLHLAYIVDIDGTVAKMDNRSPYDYTKVLDDKPKYEVLDVIRSLQYTEGALILFTSGRPDSCREDTEKWLKIYANGIEHKLLMRSTGDTRADYIVKAEIFNKNIRYEYDVAGVFDDRDQVVEMWRKLGLTCFQVQEGNF